MIFAWLIVFGLALGSFANAAVWRLHEQARVSNKRAKRTAADKDLSIIHGRSVCVHCGHPLAMIDLIPVVSFVMLRGRCRYCGKPIDDTPLVELAVPLLFVVSYLFWPYQLSLQLNASSVLFVGWLIALVAFVILAVYDFKWYLLPDRVVYPLIAWSLAIVLVRAVFFGGGWPVLMDAGWGIVLTAGIFYLLYLVSKGRWIGFGDVKLAIALGLLVGGPLPALLLLFVASLTGSSAAVPLLIQGKSIKGARIPFGPFLLLATVIVMLFGSTLVNWYTSFFTV